MAETKKPEVVDGDKEKNQKKTKKKSPFNNKCVVIKYGKGGNA